MGFDMKRGITSNRIWKNGFLSLFGSILIRAVDLISIPVFTRLLDTSTYGRVSVFTTYVQIFIVMLSLNFHGCVPRAALEYKKEKKQYYCATLLFSMLWTALVITLFNVFYIWTEELLSMSRIEFNILLIYSFSFYIIQYKSNEYIFNFQYKNNIIMSFGMALGGLGLSVLLVVTLFSEDKFLGRIIGTAIPAVMIAFVVFVRYLKDGMGGKKREYIKYALKFGVPLIPHNLSHMILSNSDRIMIQSMNGNAQSGVYSLTYNVGLMLHVITEGVGNVWRPMLYRYLEEEKWQIVRRYTRIYLIGYTIITVGVIAVSPEIIKIISAKTFWDGINLVVWVCLATYFVFVYQLFSNVEFYLKKTPIISVGTILAAILNIVLNIYGLPVWGYGFAAISTVIAYGGLAVFHCLILRHICEYQVIDNAFTLGVAGIMVAITYLFFLFRDHVLLRIFFLFFVEIVFIFILIILLKRERKNV
jgi:O-antigen/teichoic acid export membrane protein